jgi:hypothetical protein
MRASACERSSPNAGFEAQTDHANFYVIWKSEQQRSTAVDQIPCILESPILLRLRVLTTGFRKERRRMVDAFFAGSNPPSARPT